MGKLYTHEQQLEGSSSIESQELILKRIRSKECTSTPDHFQYSAIGAEESCSVLARGGMHWQACFGLPCISMKHVANRCRSHTKTHAEEVLFFLQGCRGSARFFSLWNTVAEYLSLVHLASL